MVDDVISLHLDRDQALVLYELIARLGGSDQLGIFEDQAEQRVLWDLESTLEQSLTEVFSQDYGQTVAQARRRVRDQL